MQGLKPTCIKTSNISISLDTYTYTYVISSMQLERADKISALLFGQRKEQEDTSTLN